MNEQINKNVYLFCKSAGLFTRSWKLWCLCEFYDESVEEDRKKTRQCWELVICNRDFTGNTTTSVGGLCEFYANLYFILSRFVSRVSINCWNESVCWYISLFTLYIIVYLSSPSPLCVARLFFTCSLAWFICEIDRNTHGC